MYLTAVFEEVRIDMILQGCMKEADRSDWLDAKFSLVQKYLNPCPHHTASFVTASP